MAVCLGDRDALARAEKLLAESTSKVLGHLVALESKGLFPKKHIQFFYCDDASLAGVVAGTGMQFFFDQTRPTLGLSVLDGVTKVSARGTRPHIAAGVYLPPPPRAGGPGAALCPAAPSKPPRPPSPEGQGEGCRGRRWPTPARP